MHLVGRISVHYRRRINVLTPHSATTVNFDASFGKDVEKIWKKKADLCNRMWTLKLGKKSRVVSLNTIRHKLQPADSTFRGALYSELAEDLERAEDTCEWIKHDLADFLRGNEKVLTVTGPVGCGKTELADWVEERLQRPLDHARYTVL